MVVSSYRSPPPGADRQPPGLLTTPGFITELHERLAAARDVIAIQLMTFDGDESGLGVAAQLREAVGRGVSVRLLVDCFATRFVSDRPVDHPEVTAEYRATLAMFDDLRSAGVDLRFTNANGPANVFALARNHKKLYVIDDVAYLGGINVSDHNFEWHDFMVRITDPALRTTLVADFDATFDGHHQSIDETFGDITLVTNRSLEPVFDAMIASAEQRIVVASPYALDRRLAAALERATAPIKTLVMADHNNFRFLQAITPYLVNRALRAGVELCTYDSFSHSKFLLVDDDQLLVGSSNFGRHSLTCNQEIGLVIRDPAFIETFASTFLTGLVPFEPSGSPSLRAFGWLASAVMEAYLAAYARVVSPRVPLLDRRAPSGRRSRRHHGAAPAGRP